MFLRRRGGITICFWEGEEESQNNIGKARRNHKCFWGGDKESENMIGEATRNHKIFLTVENELVFTWNTITVVVLYRVNSAVLIFEVFY